MERLYDCMAIKARQPGHENMRQWFDTAVELCRNDRRVPPREVKKCAGTHLYRLGRYLTMQDQATVLPSPPPAAQVPRTAATPQQPAPPPSGEAQRVAACIEAMKQFHQAIEESSPGADGATKGMTLQMVMQSIGCASPSR